MQRFFSRFFLLALTLLAAMAQPALASTLVNTAVPAPAATSATRVVHVIDGDTFVTAGGEHVRLLGINTPELGHGRRADEPLAAEARTALERLVANQHVQLMLGDLPRDRHNRLLAHVWLNDGTWVNGDMIRQGAAHVYSFPDNREHTRALLAIEDIARTDKLGLWALPRWRVLTADADFADATIGRFHLVTGKVQHTATVKGRVYLNFGPDWRTDFSVEIRKDDVTLFREAGIDPAKDYRGRQLLVRGVLKPVNGVLVRATHPEQLEILD